MSHINNKMTCKNHLFSEKRDAAEIALNLRICWKKFFVLMKMFSLGRQERRSHRLADFGTPYFSLRRFISTGYRSSVETLKTEANRKSSLSVTQRSRASMCDRVPRLISSPANWHRVASCSWVRRNLFRNLLTCGPMMLAGVLVRIMRNLELDPILKRRLSCQDS